MAIRNSFYVIPRTGCGYDQPHHKIIDLSKTQNTKTQQKLKLSCVLLHEEFNSFFYIYIEAANNYYQSCNMDDQKEEKTSETHNNNYPDILGLHFFGQEPIVLKGRDG